MKKLCQVVGFTALAWIILIPNSYAYHDLGSGRFDLHDKPKYEDPNPQYWGGWQPHLRNHFNAFRKWYRGAAEPTERPDPRGRPGSTMTSRGILIVILNGVKGRNLVNPRAYLFSGFKINPPLLRPYPSISVPDIIRSGAAGGAGYANHQTGFAGKGEDRKLLRSGTLRGTVGVLSYQIEGLNDRLAIMWSVPHNRTLYSNWFNIKIIKNNGTNVDKGLFNSMYKAKGNPQKGRKDGQYLRFDQRGHVQQGLGPHDYCIAATMGSGRYPILDMWINNCN